MTSGPKKYCAWSIYPHVGQGFDQERGQIHPPCTQRGKRPQALSNGFQSCEFLKSLIQVLKTADSRSVTNAMKREYHAAFDSPQQWTPDTRNVSSNGSLPPLASLIQDAPQLHPQQLHHYPQHYPQQHAQGYMHPQQYPQARHYDAQYYSQQPPVPMYQTRPQTYSYGSAEMIIQKRSSPQTVPLAHLDKTPSPTMLLATPKQEPPAPSPPIKQQEKDEDVSPPKKKARKTKKAQSPTSSGSEEEDLATALKLNPIPTVENPRFDFHQLQPIRILAYQIGLSGDPNKSYRYRDIKRALFEKCAKEHVEMVDNDPYHSLLHQRLPHKLSLAQFCKRVILLVFHHIVRDGREPRFWRQKGVKHELIRKILTDCEPDFYCKVNVNVALLLHSYVAAGMTFDGALQRIKDEGHMRIY